MRQAIVNKNVSEFQLVKISIDLVHKVFGLMDCKEDIRNNPHVVKLNELANQWNEMFYNLYISKEGVK